MIVFEAGPLRGEIFVVGDKSISHRALMVAARTAGTTLIFGLNRGADVLATRAAIGALGARVVDQDEAVAVTGGALRSPLAILDARNSGTTTRLLAGLCAGAHVTATFDGDASLRRRPMERVARPLRAMGATVTTHEGRLPMTVVGIARPTGGDFELEVPSAQIKSAILLAHLDATGAVTIRGDRRSRDHTERILRHFGREVVDDGRSITLAPGTLAARDVVVPGDLSGAAFFLAAAAITPGSDLLVRDVGINPTRSGFLDALIAMGADLEIRNRRERSGEPIADIRARYRPLEAIVMRGELVVRSIDEVTLLAAVAAHASGTTRIEDASELRAKESDRLAAVVELLHACGVEVSPLPDGLRVTGGTARAPQRVLRSHDDHRIAMAAATLAAPTGPHTVDDIASIDVSFPRFLSVWRAAQRPA